MCDRTLTLEQRLEQFAVPANVNADDVIGIDDAVSTSESGSLTDEEILAEFSSDQEAMEEEEETDEVEVLEECPKKPTASEVRSAIDVLTSYSLFVNRGSRGNQKPCTENRGIGRTKLQELPTTADAAFFFWV